MLTQKPIPEVEAIYIARNFRTINDKLMVFFIEHFYATNLEQFIYF